VPCFLAQAFVPDMQFAGRSVGGSGAALYMEKTASPGKTHTLCIVLCLDEVKKFSIIVFGISG
jgi:hypothetical protein